MAGLRVFLRRYRDAAEYLAVTEGPRSLATASIEKRQFLRWARGEMRGTPRAEARRILAHLFRPIPIDQLFAPAPPAGTAASLGDGADRSTAWVQNDPRAEDAVMAAAHESARFAAHVEGSNVGPHTMEQLEADIRRIVTTYPNRPVGPVFHEVRNLRDRSFELLEGRQPPHYTRDLYMAAGVLCGVLANASFDLGRYDAAETQARTAFMCGELAGHNGLRAWVRGLQALIAYWDGRPADAVRLAEAGSGFVPERGTAQIRLASIKARAFGQLGNRTEAVAALSEADRLREGIGAEDDVLGGMMAFPWRSNFSTTAPPTFGWREANSSAKPRQQHRKPWLCSTPPSRARSDWERCAWPAWTWPRPDSIVVTLRALHTKCMPCSMSTHNAAPKASGSGWDASSGIWQ